MKSIHHLKLLSFVLITAYLLSACSGAMPVSSESVEAPKVHANIVAFTGVLEAMNGNQWTVSGRQVTVDPATSLDANIAIGDTVTVEANVAADGGVVALKIESSSRNDVSSTPSPDASPAPDVSSTPDPGTTPVAGNGAQENEVFGTVEAVTADTITIAGVTYNLADFTEMKDPISVGDQVKVHVIVNADGTFTIREIEVVAALPGQNDSSTDSDDDSAQDSDDNSTNGSSQGDDDDDDSSGGSNPDPVDDSDDEDDDGMGGGSNSGPGGG